MAFGCLAGTEPEARHALLLAQSLRAFGGDLAGSPVLALVPVGTVMVSTVEDGLGDCGVTSVPYVMPSALDGVPLAARAAGAAQAEVVAQSLAQSLVWLDSDTLILSEPRGLHLPPQASIGCRPVDHRLIGSRWDEEPSAFWRAIYAGCGVEPERVFAVRTTVEAECIRAYFNAGCLVARPPARLLRRWLAAILSLAARDEFRDLGGREALFFHQAVLAGTLLASLSPEEIFELPGSVNYPLHLHSRVDKEKQAHSLSDLETCRYESVFDHDDWASRVPMSEELRAWLQARRWLAVNG